jgi:hypothetical protein
MKAPYLVWVSCYVRRWVSTSATSTLVLGAANLVTSKLQPCLDKSSSTYNSMRHAHSDLRVNVPEFDRILGLIMCPLLTSASTTDLRLALNPCWGIYLLLSTCFPLHNVVLITRSHLHGIQTLCALHISRPTSPMTSSAASSNEITAPSDWHPDPSRSLPLSAARQALINDIIALYSCHPTRERILRYTPDCVYDDQFVHADDRYKVAGQWYALPQLFEASTNEGYQVVRSDDKVIQFKIAQVSSPSLSIGAG